METENYLAIWTVYDSPDDYAGQFVARKWLAIQGDPVPTGVLVMGETLQEVRNLLPPGLHRLPRQPGDDPNIVECWL